MKSLQISALPAKKAPNVGIMASKMGHDTVGENSFFSLMSTDRNDWDGGGGGADVCLWFCCCCWVRLYLACCWKCLTKTLSWSFSDNDMVKRKGEVIKEREKKKKETPIVRIKGIFIVKKSYCFVHFISWKYPFMLVQRLTWTKEHDFERVAGI